MSYDPHDDEFQEPSADFDKTMNILKAIRPGNLIQWVGEKSIDLWGSDADDIIEIDAVEMMRSFSGLPSGAFGTQATVPIQISQGSHYFLGPMTTIEPMDVMMFLEYKECYDDFTEALGLRVSVLFGERSGFIEIYTEPVEVTADWKITNLIDCIRILGRGTSA